MSAEARTHLAAQQAELLAALAGGGAIPAGFDAVRIHATARALALKRRESVRRAWPALADAVQQHFAAYASATSLPLFGGPLADGRAFVRWLAAHGEVPDAARLQALAVDLRFRTTTAGLGARRGPALKAAWLRAPRRLVVALRWPGLADWWFGIPLWR